MAKSRLSRESTTVEIGQGIPNSTEARIEKYKRQGMRYRVAEMRPPASEEMPGIAERLKIYGLNAKVRG